ncbi:MAG TPA: dipeptidase [Bacillota bacterium]|nr:dipeptidase [Bacillota bacterium]
MQAARLHAESLVVDAHCDTVLRMIRSDFALGEEHPDGHIDLPRLKRGGVDLQFFALYIEPQFKPDRSAKRVLQLLDAFYREQAANADALSVALSVSDIKEARQQGKVAALLSIEGGEALEGDLGVLRMMHRLGVRAIGLTWNQRNEIADGVGEKSAGGGLTDFGRQVVTEMNRLGMIVDVSHLSERSFWDCIETSRQPIIASHSNAKALCGHVRNLTDDQIVALAKNGGVMGINLSSEFLVQEGQASIADVVRHIDHICALVGPEHVGLGADFDGIKEPPFGLMDVSQFPALTEALVEHGFDEIFIKGFLGGNFMRVIETVIG